jgi:hypothetical protein
LDPDPLAAVERLVAEERKAAGEGREPETDP